MKNNFGKITVLNIFYIVASSLLLLVWIPQTNTPYPIWLFVLLQAISIMFFVNWLIKKKMNVVILSLTVFMAGWVISFILSVILEAIFSNSFGISIREQLNEGIYYLLKQFFGWFIVSIVYFGWLQGLIYLLVACRMFKKSIPIRGNSHGKKDSQNLIEQ